LSAGLADAGRSLLTTFMSPDAAAALAQAGFHQAATDARVPVRNASVKGPLDPRGDWFVEKAGPAAASLAIARVPRSDDVTYEILNFIDGARSVSEIRDAVSAEFEPVDLKAVAEYVDLLAKAGAVTFK
jgi:hypothetical protein